MKRSFYSANGDSKSAQNKILKRDISDWSHADVIAWLKNEGIDQFEAYFAGTPCLLMLSLTC